MNKKMFAVISSFFMILFFPVYLNVIIKGTDENYNILHKLETKYTNRRLLLFALLCMAALFFLYLTMSRLKDQIYTYVGACIFAAVICIAMYAVNIYIAKRIAFYGGWDCGMVANSARWFYAGEPLGHGDYLYIFSNNIPIIWLLYKIYKFAVNWSAYPYNPEFLWIQYQCILYSFAAFFASMTVLVVSKKWLHSAITVLAAFLFLGLTPWEIIPYTDGATISFPIMAIFWYACSCRTRNGKHYFFWTLAILSGTLGGIMKTTVFVVTIAIAITEVLSFPALKSKDYKGIFIKIGLFCGAFAAAFLCRSGMYRTIGYERDTTWETSWSNYLYMGLNEEETGAANGDGFVLIYEMHPISKQERQKVELHLAWNRIKEFGFRGTVNFYFRKLTMNFNDGTFSWFKEGAFNAGTGEFEYLSQGSAKEVLRDFYWEDGGHILDFNTYSQSLWIWILTCMVIGLLTSAVIGFFGTSNSITGDKAGMRIRSAIIISLTGIFIFVTVFEGRARYLLNFAPVFLTAGMTGLTDFYLVLRGLLKTKKS